jgi:hypothetical protein
MCFEQFDVDSECDRSIAPGCCAVKGMMLVEGLNLYPPEIIKAITPTSTCG